MTESQSDALDGDIKTNKAPLLVSACAVVKKWSEDWNEKKTEGLKNNYFWLDTKDGRLGCTECQYGLSQGLSIMNE